MNKIIISGNLCKEIELKTTASNNSRLSNTVAVKNDFKTGDEYLTEFINIVAWNHNAEYLSKYATKGNKVLVEGRLTNRTYDKEDGTKGYTTEVVVEKVEILRSNNPDKAATENQQPTVDPFADIDNELPLTDDDLPF